MVIFNVEEKKRKGDIFMTCGKFMQTNNTVIYVKIKSDSLVICIVISRINADKTERQDFLVDIIWRWIVVRVLKKYRYSTDSFSNNALIAKKC